MKFVDKTSDYTMSDFYKVLEWIPRSEVDRQEPCDLKKSIIKDNNYIIPTIYEEFNGIDEVQIFINFNGVHVDVPNISLDFSPVVNGNVSVLQAKCDDEHLNYDEDTVITFKLDNNITFTDKTRVITGIKSLKLNFGTDPKNITISNILMRCYNYTYTLTDIEKALITGENYVTAKLGHFAHRGIPKRLQNYVYMAGGAFAWLTRWEYETKPMKEPKSESNNYADRLLGQVDSAIAKYLADVENKSDHRDLHHAIASRVDWGIR